MRPPSEVVLLILLLFGSFFAALGILLVFLVTRVLRWRIGWRGRILLTAAGLSVLLISTVWVQGRQDGVTVQIFGHEPYEGAELNYGIPLVWISRFEPYDQTVQYLYVFPHNFYFVGLIVDFLFWLVVSTILIWAIKKHSDQS